MVKGFIIWGLMSLLMAVLHLFANGVASFAMLVAAVFVPMLSLLSLIMFSHRAGIGFTLDFPPTVYKKEGISGNVAMDTPRLGAFFGVTAQTTFTNKLTGESHTEHIAITGDYNLAFRPKHCGVGEIALNNIRVRDPLGLFSLSIRRDVRHEITVLPETFYIDVALTGGLDTLADNDEYSMTCAGNDPSEIYAIREYIGGDPIKAIHWKLSEKLDKTMVREFGLPISNDTLIMLDFGYSEGGKAPSGDAISAMAEAFTSLALGLLSKGIAPDIAFMRDGAPVTLPIRNEGDLGAQMAEYLAQPPMMNDNIADSLSGDNKYLHIAIVTHRYNPSLHKYGGDKCLTQLVCGDINGAAQGRVKGFVPEGMEAQLGYLEI